MRCIKFLLAALIFTTRPAFAQIGYGPELGLNISGYSDKVDGKKVSTDVKYGGMFGGLIEIEMNNHLFLLPGLYYYRNGYAMPYVNETKTIGINTFEIPVSLEYKFGPPDRVKFFVGAGPYVAINTGGTVAVGSTPVYSTEDIKIGSDSSNDIKRIDAGMGVWGVYQITRGLFFRARYQQGFLNLLPHGNSDNALMSRSFTLSVGYVFPGDLKAKEESKKNGEKDDNGKVERKNKGRKVY